MASKTNVLRDVCVDNILDKWTTVSVAPVCSVSDILKELQNMHIPTKGTTIAKLSEEEEEILVSLVKILG